MEKYEYDHIIPAQWAYIIFTNKIVNKLKLYIIIKKKVTELSHFKSKHMYFKILQTGSVMVGHHNPQIEQRQQII